VLIDTSAVLAILLGEPESQALVEAIVASPVRRIGAPTLVEAAAVLMARKGKQGEIALDALVQRLSIEVVPMSIEAAGRTRSAYQRFGRGVGSPAVLNYGDCLAYGIAMASGDALLFKGDDFGQTDVIAAPW
jgi:ribonuclease VapC